jgi:hypothetical protein
MNKVTLLLHERLLLLVLDDENGTSQSPHAEPALAGALLLAVLNTGAVEVEGGRLSPAAGTAPDGVLSDVASTIAEEPKPRSPRWWVDHLPGRLKPFLPRLANRLVGAGVLTEEQHKLLGLFTSAPRFPERDHAPAEEVRERLRAVLVGESSPQADDAVLAGLVGAAGLTQTAVGKDRRKQAQRRAEELGAGNELGEAVRQAIEATQEAIITATTVATTAAIT